MALSGATIHLYRYVNNGSPNFTDPSGLYIGQDEKVTCEDFQEKLEKAKTTFMECAVAKELWDKCNKALDPRIKIKCVDGQEHEAEWDSDSHKILIKPSKENVMYIVGLILIELPRACDDEQLLSPA
jgi:hypothetical protein